MRKLTACLFALLLVILPVSAEGYGAGTDPAVLAQVIEDARSLPTVRDLYFTPDTELLENTAVRYYSGENMLCLVWQKPVGHTVYSFFEVCVAEPSQFGRYLPGNISVGGTRMNVEEMADELGAVLVSSGDFYGLRGVSVEVNEGQLVRCDSQMVLDLCMVDYNGDLHCVPRGTLTTADQIRQYVAENNINFCLEFGPTVIENGRRVAWPGDYLMGQNNGEFTRAALCQIGPLHYLIVIANTYGGYWQAPTLSAFVDVLEETGCVTAYTLDGGQTASAAFNGKLVNQVNYGGMRKLSDCLYFMAN